MRERNVGEVDPWVAADLRYVDCMVKDSKRFAGSGAFTTEDRRA
jgi:hypothetical protein